MSLTLPAAAARLRREVTTAEAAFDAALLASSAIQQTIVTSRRELELPAHTGQQALIRLSRAVQGQITTANDIFRAHEELHRIAKQELMVSGEEDKPEGFLVQDETAVSHAA